MKQELIVFGTLYKQSEFLIDRKTQQEGTEKSDNSPLDVLVRCELVDPAVATEETWRCRPLEKCTAAGELLVSTGHLSRLYMFQAVDTMPSPPLPSWVERRRNEAVLTGKK